MTDRSPEDELIAEARKFGYAMKEMLRLHAQAGNWLERRRIRKQINLELRQQRRSEQADRENQLVWTQQMIDRYRAHSVAVTDRGGDPSVDHERRYRDSQALARHAGDLRARIVANGRLTKVEQGIALDGLDAATIFPRFEPGRFFTNAHKVRGVDALRYRAHVARTIREYAAPQHEQRRQAPTYQARLAWMSGTGQDPVTETRGFDTAREGLEWMHRDIDHTMWVDGQTVDASLRDPAGRQVYHRHGAPETVAEQLEQPLGIIRDPYGGYRQNPSAGFFADADTLADHQRTVADAHAEQLHPAAERPPQQPGKPFVVNVGPSDVLHLDDVEYAKVPPQDRTQLRTFDTREQAYNWTLHQLDTYRDTSSRAGEDFSLTIREQGRVHDAEIVDGPLGMVTDEVRALREQHLRPQRGQATEPSKTRPAEQQSAKSVDPDRFAQIERQLSDISDDRDRLENRVGMLQRGLDAVTADRDEMKRKLDAAEGHIEALKNRNIRLANEIGELRDRPTVDQVAAERDRYKREHDEAVQKLAQATPEHERYGSPEHRAAEERRNGRAEQRSGGPDFHAWRAWKQQQLAEQAAADARRQEMAEAYGDSQAFAEHLRSIDPDQTRFTTLGQRTGEFMRWWDEDGGAEKYQRERSSRETTDRAAGQRLDDTQPWRPTDVDPHQDIERNGQRRNGIERSR
ncbi:hypothetical protein ACQP1G_34225 [Nocardia sp. CA-107356]|uniref:hypothetical protein n=1 Tax=Nocardia sp. CA-107356 TaxID=3239972 RepID=UPI003D8D8B26